MADFAWTEQAVTDLKLWFGEGRSCSCISMDLHAKYGGYPSRSAVIGKLHRIGLGRWKKGEPRAKAAPATRRYPGHRGARRIVNHGNRLEVAIQNGSAPKLPAEMQPDDIPVSQRVSLLELKDSLCHWPYGDPGTAGFFFCGGEVKTGSYCAFHARRSVA
jgi:GcrA cell cycle regulator